ncbi:MAG TPA: Crp/Fnr family transcriptional regulator, partial [Coleofasciculaceae cyanobacterium]
AIRMAEMTVATVSSTNSADFKKSLFFRRALLPESQDYLWQIEAGVVRTYTLFEDGTIVTLGLWGVGDVVGRVLSTAEPYQMECLTPVEVIPLPLDRWHLVNEVLIRHIQQYQEFLEILHSRSVDMSLLRLLNWLGKRFGQEVEQGQLIDLQLTHQEISEVIGTTRVTVTRMLKDFEKQGLIERISRKLIILPEKQSFWHYEI